MAWLYAEISNAATPRDFYNLAASSLPKTVKIAVSINRLDLVTLTYREADLGLFTGMQLLALISLLCVYRNPLDEMLGQHGMLDRAYLYLDDTILHRPNRNVLFYSGVCSAGDYLRHLFAAAHDGKRRSPLPLL